MPSKNLIKLFKNGKRLFLTTDERHVLKKLLYGLSPEIRIYFRLLYYTGCKASEALLFSPNQIVRNKSEVILGISGKKLQKRIVPIPQALHFEMITHIGTRSLSSVKPILDKSRTQAYRFGKEIFNKANIIGPQATCTGLRHSFAISCLEMSPPVPLSQIQKWMGISDIRYASSYFEAFRYDEYQNINRVWEYF